LEKARRIEEFAGFVAANYHRTAEIGIGCFPDVACALIEAGCDVFATDILPFEYDKVKVILDDVTKPDLSRYNGVDLIYSMRPPPELVPYMGQLAETVSADLIIRPLSSEYPEGMQLMRIGKTTCFLKRQREVFEENEKRQNKISDPPSSPFRKGGHIGRNGRQRNYAPLF
jgi:uncharacterized UPF0146 family protein